MTSRDRFRTIAPLGLIWITLWVVPPAAGQQAETAEAPSETAAADASKASADSAPVEAASNRPASGTANLRFSFSSASWADVLAWFAQEADLSLQLDQIPSGTFTFSDPSRSYTVAESLDVINLALMKRGYSLVRRGRMLQVIDLEMDNADKLISEIAELVQPEDLDDRAKSDIVTAVFALGSLTPEQAREELPQLVGPWGRVTILESARQVKITETAEKLIAIRELLRSAATADSEVVEIVLQHRSSDEILEIARPLLGLEPGASSNEEIRISVGLYGDRLYAAGLPGKTGLLQTIVEKADQPLAAATDDDKVVGTPSLQTHPITSADPTAVFEVLQTLLAGTPDARLSIEPQNNSIIAWGRAETHRLVADTIATLEGRGQEFKVIDLQRLDPAQALLTINKFFGVTESGGRGPIVDGDPSTGKLWVRGTPDQIALVERLLAELEDAGGTSQLGEQVRILPYGGQDAEAALQRVQQIWSITGRTNQIRTLAPAGDLNDRKVGIPERRVPREGSSPAEVRQGEPTAEDPPRPDQPEAKPRAGDETRSGTPAYRQTPHRPYRLVSEPDERPAAISAENADRDSVAGADIVVQVTPAGLLVVSADLEALDAFESLMASFAEPAADDANLPTIFWLKYIKADAAAELVSNILGGSETSVASAVDSVTSGLGGGMLGLLGLGGGGDGEAGGQATSARSILTSTGSVNLIPDARLNALIVQAGPADLRMIEMILVKVDREESPEDIQTVSKPALIPVLYQDAADVAEVVKSVFGERIAGAQSNGPSRSGPSSPREFIEALRGGGDDKKSESKPTSEPTKISIAVDAKSNALVVVATPQDFEEVRQLVAALDDQGMASEQTILTHTMDGNVNPEVLRMALQSILGTEATTTTSANSARPGARSAGTAEGPSASEDAENERRLEFLRMLRERMNRSEAGDASRRGERDSPRGSRRGSGRAGARPTGN